jgi:uncharacterized protein (TIGR02231 family)
MQRVTLLSATVLIATASCCLIAPTARALGPAVAHADDALAPIASRADLPITGVTVYRSRAAVTRSGAPKLAQGVHELRVGPIPSFADLESVQAKIGEGAKLLDLKTETVALPAPSSDNPRVREALEAVDTARAALADVDRRIANNASSLKLIDSIAAKAASDASQSLGSALDPEKLRAQIAFVAGERDRLTAESLELARLRVKAAGELSAREQALARAGGAPPAERYALVTIAVPSGGAVPMSLTYLVANAVWSPTYTVRGDPSAGTLAIEFDAVVKQATGEDWTDVTLALSTAEPARAANPRTIDATYLSLYDPTQPPAVAAPAMAPGAPMNMSAKRRDPAGGGFGSAGEDKDAEAEFGEKLVRLSEDAGVGGSGAAVEYRLPRTFSARSDASAERRTRVATIDAKPAYSLVARPLVDADVYMRARLTNESGYTLLPGVARVYLGGDSIGTTRLGETPTGGELELWFGKEPRVTVKRELVSKKASESGVFSKSKGIDREYRVSLVNTMPQAVAVEVWDRVAVSRDEKIKLELTGVAPALAADAKYLKDERPQGLLKWVLSLPARGEGREAAPTAIVWKTRTVWPEGLSLVGDAD